MISLTLLDPAPAADVAPPPSAAPFPLPISTLHRLHDVERLVGSLVASWHRSSDILQARRWHRMEYRQPLGLTPLNDHSERPRGPMRLVIGRDLSLGGLSFGHLDPLPCRKVAVTFPLDDGSVESVVVRLTWCRFTRIGVYHSGGAFLRRIEVPTESGLDLRSLPRA